MGSQAEEVDWDRLDKNKFFLYGAGMFSGVTLTLYPLSVIKTKQMTLPGISGGFQGVKQTASTIMRIEGIPGFYRGFGTVMFGTIPARSVYLTTLEWTKSEVAKVVGDLGLTGPVAAGVANFAGGAVASLATQSVTVPIDVISQKQMVHGDETVVARHQHSRGGAVSVTASRPGPSAASSAASTSAAGGSAGGQAPGPGMAAAAAGPGGHGLGSVGVRGPAAAPGAAPSFPPVSATNGASGGALPAAATKAPGAGLLLSSSSSSSSAAAAPSSPAASVASATVPPSSSSSSPLSSSSSPPSSSSAAAAAPSEALSRTMPGASTSGRTPHTQVASAVRRIGALQMVRLILKEEGIGGLYRGFGASVATFVPSSAVWWGAYGTYQKLIWALRYHSPGEAGGGVAAAAAVAVPGDGAAATAVPGGQPPVGHSTGEVVAVQTLSSVLAGFTSGLLTTPVDLVKTRIQVSYKHDGATPTFGEVARQIMREDGVGGFLRGAVPRMLNASLWGTCMVTVYEYLKRTCAKADET